MLSLTNRTILITGGTGFVGSRLAERLLMEHQAQVRVLVRNWNSAVHVTRCAVDLVPGDVRDPQAVHSAMQDCDIVYHCASGGNSDREYFDINENGTRNVLEAAQKHNVDRLVHVSSVAVHGPSPADSANEEAPFVYTGKAYSDSKIRAEELVWKFWRQSQIPMVVIRPTFVWGPRSHLFTVRQLREMRSGTFRLVDHGRGRCHAVYVDHLVDALIRSASCPDAVGRAFLITDEFQTDWATFFGHYASWLNIERLPSINSHSRLIQWGAKLNDSLNRLAMRLSPNPAPFHRKVVRRLTRIAREWLAQRGMCTMWDLQKFSRQSDMDTTAAREILGYRPKYSLEQAMQQTYHWAVDQLGDDLDLSETDAFLDAPFAQTTNTTASVAP